MTAAEQKMLEDLFGAGVAEHHQTGLRLIVVPRVKLPAGCTPAESFAVYVPSTYQGYPTRLYLEQPVRLASGAQPQTTTAVLLGRTLHAASINDIPATLPLHQGILAHVERYGKAA